MDPRIAPLLPTLDLNHALVGKLFRLFSDEDLASKPALPDTNRPKWLLGHVLNSRQGLLALCGGADERQWDAVFGRGSTGELTDAAPALSELAECWMRLREQTHAVFNALPAAMLDAESPVTLPVQPPLFINQIVFMVAHEGMHIGQLSLLAKGLGAGELFGR